MALSTFRLVWVLCLCMVVSADEVNNAVVLSVSENGASSVNFTAPTSAQIAVSVSVGSVCVYVKNVPESGESELRAVKCGTYPASMLVGLYATTATYSSSHSRASGWTTFTVSMVGHDSANAASIGWTMSTWNVCVSKDDDVWWTTSAQYVYHDRISLALIICTAVFFEVLHRMISNLIARNGKRFFTVKLWHRVNSEFMVLGFIAASVWIGHKLHWFDVILEWLSSSTRTFAPSSEHFLRELIEDVHMRLFLSMVTYFCILAAVIHNTEAYMKAWADGQETILNKKKAQELDEASSTDKKVKWATKMEKEFRFIEAKFRESLVRGDQKHIAVPPEKVDKFNFAAYLIRSQEDLLDELVHIKLVTWFGTAVLATMIAIVSRYGGLTDTQEFWLQMVGLNYVMAPAVVGLWLFTEWSYRRLVSAPGWPATVCGFRRPLSEAVTIRLLQIFVFYCCYTLVYFSISPDQRAHFAEDKRLIVVFVVTYIIPFVFVCFVIVPRLLPRFNVIFRLPPFVDNDDKEQMQEVLLGHFHTNFFNELFPKSTHRMLKRARDNAEWKTCKGCTRKLLEESSGSFSADSFFSDGDSVNGQGPRLGVSASGARERLRRTSNGGVSSRSQERDSPPPAKIQGSMKNVPDPSRRSINNSGGSKSTKRSPRREKTERDLVIPMDEPTPAPSPQPAPYLKHQKSGMSRSNGGLADDIQNSPRRAPARLNEGRLNESKAALMNDAPSPTAAGSPTKPMLERRESRAVRKVYPDSPKGATEAWSKQ